MIYLLHRDHALMRLRTFTRLFESGYDIRTVQELLGHSDVSTTLVYLRVLNRAGQGIIVHPMTALERYPEALNVSYWPTAEVRRDRDAALRRIAKPKPPCEPRSYPKGLVPCEYVCVRPGQPMRVPVDLALHSCRCGRSPCGRIQTTEAGRSRRTAARYGTPEEIAELMAFIVSPGARCSAPDANPSAISGANLRFRVRW